MRHGQSSLKQTVPPHSLPPPSSWEVNDQHLSSTLIHGTLKNGTLHLFKVLDPLFYRHQWPTNYGTHDLQTQPTQASNTRPYIPTVWNLWTLRHQTIWRFRWFVKLIQFQFRFLKSSQIQLALLGLYLSSVVASMLWCESEKLPTCSNFPPEDYEHNGQSNCKQNPKRDQNNQSKSCHSTCILHQSVCCPSSFSLYNLLESPTKCTYQETPRAWLCSESLFKTYTQFWSTTELSGTQCDPCCYKNQLEETYLKPVLLYVTQPLLVMVRMVSKWWRNWRRYIWMAVTSQPFWSSKNNWYPTVFCLEWLCLDSKSRGQRSPESYLFTIHWLV